jgi:Zn-dependent metalloprotease
MTGNILVFSLMVALASAIASFGCAAPKENNLMAAPENKGLSEKRSFPPDADLRLNPENGTVQYLKLRNPSQEQAGISSKREGARNIALCFVESHRTIFKLQQPHDELRCSAEETDELGLKHVRFQQIHREIPVWGRELNVHLDQQDRVYLVQGRYVPTPQHVDTQPSISVQRAIETVFKSLGVGRKNVEEDAAELVIYIKPPENTLLAYKVIAPGWMYFVDAVRGDIIDRIATRQAGRGAFAPLKTEEIRKR